MIKVFMLPQLPIKECLFTPRLTCYNETFTPILPLGNDFRHATKQERGKPNACVLWHDAVAGRG